MAPDSLAVPTLHIDPEFEALIPPLSTEERQQLEANLLRDGCRDALVAWDGVILDGHNRFEICERLNIPFSVVSLDLPDRDAAATWIDTNQLGRRNLSPMAASEIRGRLYNRLKKSHGGDRKSNPQSEDLKTSEILAKQQGVSRATIERDGQFADAVETLKPFVPNIQQRVMTGDGLSKSAVIEAAREPERAADILRKPHVSQNSGNNEWYTPSQYIEAARAVMGGIDLDPASSVEANAVVNAGGFFTADDDGLTKHWWGRVWMNPPYAQPLVANFCEKLAESVEAGDVSSAIVLVNNATDTQWFRALVDTAAAICFPTGRIRFWSPERESATPLQGQAFVYFGTDVDRFALHFGQFGFMTEVRR